MEGREGSNATRGRDYLTVTAVQSEEGGVGGASRLGMIDAGRGGKGREDLSRLIVVVVRIG